MHMTVRCLWKLSTWYNLGSQLPGISSTQSRNCLYYGSNEMFILAESTRRGFFVFCFFMFSQHLVLAARSPQHPAWHQGFKTFLKWQNVCAGVYFNISQWFWTGCFSRGCFCSVFCFFFFISGRNADKCKQSLFKAFFFLSFFSPLKTVIPNPVSGVQNAWCLSGRWMVC